MITPEASANDHLSWDEQLAADVANPFPCACWLDGEAGRKTPNVVRHPKEWHDGALAAYERAHDI
jgi:hypothetical protein